MKKTISYIALSFIFFQIIGHAQINDIELESLDDLSILEEFEQGSESEAQEAEDEVEDETDIVFKNVDEEDPLLDELADDDSFLNEESDEELAFAEEEEKAQEDSKAAIEELTSTQSINEVEENGLSPEELTNITPFEEADLADKTTPIEELQDNNDEINRKLINDFAKIKDSQVDQVVEEVKKNNKSRFTHYEINVLKVQLKDIAKSPIKVFQITKGAKLIRISDSKVLYTPKTITVRAHTLTDFYKNKYVIDKKGKLLYKVHFQSISDIGRITNLYRAPRRFKRLEKKIKKVIYDDKFDFSVKFNVHTGLSSPEYTKSLLSDPSPFAPLLRLESTIQTNQKFFFEPGFSFMYESVSGNFESNGNYNISSFSVGPSLKSQPLLFDFGLIIQPRVSLQSQVNYSKNGFTNQFDLAETTFLLGLEKEKYYKGFGHYTFGLNFQRKWIKADSNTVFIELGNHVDHDDSFALSFGHRSDWIW